MAWVCGSIVIGLVAPYTGIGCGGIIAIDVAKAALVSNRSMSPGKGVECAVIKRRRRPCILSMTISTSRDKLVCFVIRIDGIVIICLVAPHAGIRCSRIVSVDVALCTLVCNSCVGTQERIKRVVIKG